MGSCTAQRSLQTLCARHCRNESSEHYCMRSKVRNAQAHTDSSEECDKHKSLGSPPRALTSSPDHSPAPSLPPHPPSKHDHCTVRGSSSSSSSSSRGASLERVDSSGRVAQARQRGDGEEGGRESGGREQLRSTRLGGGGRERGRRRECVDVVPGEGGEVQNPGVGGEADGGIACTCAT